MNADLPEGNHGHFICQIIWVTAFTALNQAHINTGNISVIREGKLTET